MKSQIKKIGVWIIAIAMLLVTLIGATATATDTTSYGYWSLDDSDSIGNTTAIDSNNTHNGTGSGTVSGYTGLLNQAWDIGQNDEIVIATGAQATDFDCDSCTVCSWINTTNVGTENHIFSHDNGGAPARGWYVNVVATGKVRFFCDNGDYETSDSQHVWANSWYHVCAVKNGTSVTLYVNGTSVASSTTGTITASCATPAGETWIGNAPGYGNIGVRGQLDEVFYAKEAKAPSVITTLYNSHAGYNPFGGGGSPTSYLDIAITNQNTFNATINGTVWTTTNGTINTNITNTSVDITIYATNYFNKSYIGHNASVDISTTLYEYPIINSYNRWNGSKILNANHTIQGTAYYPNATGDTHVPYNTTQNVTTQATSYVSQVDEIALTQDTIFNTSQLYQSLTRLNSTEITTGNLITWWNISTPVGTFGTTNGTIIIYPNLGNHTWNWTADRWYLNVTGITVPINETEENLTLSGFWARNITFVNNLTSTAIQPNCEQDGTNYTSTDYLMPNSTTDLTCTLTGFQDATITLNATPDTSEYRIDPALLWLIFDTSTTGYVETEDCDEYPANCENFSGTSVYIQQSNLSIGRVSVKFNPEGGNTSNYQQVFEYDNTNNTHIKEYIKIITPDLVQQVKVTGERSPIEDARVTALNLGQNPDTNATDWLTVFADFTNTDGFATILLNDEDTYKICAQATGYTTKCEIHYIAPASTETILIDLDPTTTTAGHNFIASSCPSYYTTAQSCTLEVNTYQSYSQICVNYTSATLNTTSCDSNSVTKTWAYSLSNTTGNITIEVLLDGTIAQNITHIYEAYDPTVKIDFESNEDPSGNSLMDKIQDNRTYLIVVYILLTIIGVIMGFMAEKYFNGYGLYGAGVWFMFLAIGKLYIFWIPVMIIGVHAIINKLIPLFQNR